MSDADREKFYADWTADMKKNWTIDNGDLVNHGKGAYVATKDYGDVEFMVDYKMVAKVDSGIYMKGTPQVQVWDPTDPKQIPERGRQGERRPLEQPGILAGEGSIGPGGQPDRPVE